MEIKMNVCTYETQAGETVDDPFIRVSLYTDRETKLVIREPILDASKPIRDTNQNVVGFEKAVDASGKVYNANNIHEFITNGSIHMGVLCMPSVSISSQGISIPTSIKNHVVKKGVSNKVALTTYFDASELANMAISEPNVIENNNDNEDDENAAVDENDLPDATHIQDEDDEILQ